MTEMDDYLSESQPEVLDLLDSYVNVSTEQLSSNLARLFALLARENNISRRKRIQDLISRLRRIPEVSVELEKKERDSLIQKFRTEMKGLGDEKNSLATFTDAFIRAKQRGRERLNAIRGYVPDENESFFWSMPDKYGSNSMKIRALSRLSPELLEDIRALALDSVRSMLFNEQGILVYSRRHQETSGAVLGLHRLISRVATLSSRTDITAEEEDYLGSSSAVQSVRQYITRVEGIISSFLDDSHPETNMRASIEMREKAITDLKQHLDMLRTVGVKRTRHRILFTNVVNRTRQKLNAKYKLFLRKGHMNILMLGIPTSIASGVVTSFQQLSDLLDKRGLNVFIVTHWWHQYFFMDREHGKYMIDEKPGMYGRNEISHVRAAPGEKGNYARVDISPFNISDSAGKNISFDFKWAGKNALDYLIDDIGFHPDILHVHTHTFQHDNALDIIKKKAGNIPIVFTVHCLIPYVCASDEMKQRIRSDAITSEERTRIRATGYASERERAQEAMFGIADRIIFIAPVWKQAFDNLYPEYAHKSVTIGNVNTIGTQYNDETLHAARILREKYLGSPDGKAILYSGRIEKMKMVGTLCRAFNLIHKAHPEVRLFFVGALKAGLSPEEYAKAEQDKISDLVANYDLDQSLARYVRILPWLTGKDLAAHYRMAYTVIMPGKSYGLYSSSALDGMALKVPVISVEGPVSVGSSKDEHEIANSFNRLISMSDAERGEHIKKAKSYVDEYHSPDVIFDRCTTIYKELTTNR